MLFNSSCNKNKNCLEFFVIVTRQNGKIQIQMKKPKPQVFNNYNISSNIIKYQIHLEKYLYHNGK